MRTRFAPSPTGDLHLGGVWTALASWALARAAGGSTVLRMEDIDTPRVVRGSSARIEEDLAWLGFDWDERYVQSDRTAIYEEAIARLDAQGLVYPCDCSRAEIARVASAPHAGEEVIYPGTCRTLSPTRALKRPPALRLRVPDDTRIAFDDRIVGRMEQDVGTAAGDFVLRRGDGVFAYQIVVAVDDAMMKISDVVRADDLLASTARQILLMRLLGHTEVPRYAHIPLVVALNGERMAKRALGTTVRERREAGEDARMLIGALAKSLGLVGPSAAPYLTPHEVAAELRPPAEWRREPWRFSQPRSAK
jgi:glutamyl-tRNA synthetase